MGFQADMRAAAVTLLGAYKSSASINLQIYPARPRTILPPTAFVDVIRESITYTGLRQRNVTVECVVVHGIFDSKDAADQKDAFVDGFLDWATANPHAAGGDTILGITETDDLPNYVPEWMPPEQQKVYYATRISMEGLSA